MITVGYGEDEGSLYAEGGVVPDDFPKEINGFRVLPPPADCYHCQGTGRNEFGGEETRACHVCKGSGKNNKTLVLGCVTCNVCKGSGKSFGAACFQCNGKCFVMRWSSDFFCGGIHNTDVDRWLLREEYQRL